MVSSSNNRQVGRLLTLVAAASIIVVALIWLLTDFNGPVPNRSGLATAGVPTLFTVDTNETFSAGTTTVRVTSINATNASIRWPTSAATVAWYNISIGESIPVGTGYTVTLLAVSRTTWTAHFQVATTALACSTLPQQTPYCRGGSACCDGSCQLLPSCVGRADGQISTCGARTFYCCDQTLSLIACGASA